MTEALDPLRFPLWGSRLIEASAGTGKTWTIAALYLRLVLGHGEAGASFTRPLLPAEILVMTFTRAATRELSDRIRERLLDAARCFRGDPQAKPDPFMLSLLAGFESGPARERAAWQLSLAAESMDDAAVHTIDAWCQRMLREHAFDSGCLFDEELQGDEAELQLLAAQDYWRAELYPLRGDTLEQALAVWPSVTALSQDARSLLDFSMPEGAGTGSLGELIARSIAEHAAALADLKLGWAARAEAMQNWLDGLFASKTCPFNKAKLAQRHYSNWLTALASWANEPELLVPDVKTGATRFTPEGMAEAWKEGQPMALPAEFAAFAQLMQALECLPQPRTKLREHAAARIQLRLAELKQKAGTFGFADMLSRLDRALDPALNGPNALRLRERMLKQYPVALIDEFQDTSPLQLRIFNRLYALEANDAQSALLLIGDPKQSIYGFRGADIYSYLRARHATAGRHYMLGTNHRSTQDLVDSVNTLFVQAESRAGEGAFMFRAAGDEGAGAGDDLPFEPVAAKGRAERLVLSGQSVTPALSFAFDAELRDGKSSQRLFAAHCAERIVTLLNDEGAGFESAQAGSFVRLRPADMAVLVRTGREALAVRRELRRRGVASVYLSDKDSVFASAEALDLLRWLKAVAAPLDTRLVRAALATGMLALSLDELARLAADDEAFEARSEQLKALRQVWLKQGVLAMLRQTLHRLDLPARWLQDEAANGERQLTNFLHLAELLQAASRQLEGEQALVRWLATEIEDAAVGGGAGGDEQVLRLESDADLVKVVTVHKSKGLEYPLVFLPFACSYRAVEQARSSFVKVVDEAGESQLHLQLNKDLVAAADRDRLREDLRLLYVALTRARHALWVGVAALNVRGGKDCTAHRSALGYLLGGPDKMDAAELQACLEHVVQGRRAFALLPMPNQAPVASALRSRGAPPALCELQTYAAEFERNWTIGSFSALVRALAQPGAASAAAAATAVSVAAARDDEAAEAADAGQPGGSTLVSALSLASSPSLSETEGQDLAPWHAFPRGALAGNFLHDQLEWLLSEQTPGVGLAGSPDLQEQLRRRCERGLWAKHEPKVQAWLGRVCSRLLPPLGLALQDIRHALPEMEFWFPSAGLAVDELDSLCRQHLLGGPSRHTRPELPQRQLRGMLMGFADLVFEADGRYFVLDYKSNALGWRDEDYHPEALEAAMAAHRYEVQAAIYLLALHRLLQARLGAGYDPEQHLGGAVFYFLRGVNGPAAGCYTLRPPVAFLTQLDRLFQQQSLQDEATAP
ncbi:exodeoxyribonuclease V subunit beta [Roseateles sp. PN1]|uniref:exodeoxyribonuclease V subunit beta n=1 Tax=Roseateles sp. PN1 TaxID=3137372 RepID=UPI00313A121C